MAERVSDVFDRAAREHADWPAMKVKKDGVWRTTSWRDYHEQARLCARGFMKLGLMPGQGVAIIGYNCPQWFISDVGAILAGGMPAGIYTTSSAEQCQYITDHCDAPIAVVENAEQLKKFQKVRADLPKLKAIVMMHGQPEPGAEGVYAWERLIELGAEVPEAELDRRIAAQKPDDVCTLIYTSGTTGPPKAVMISHDNLTWTASTGIRTMGAQIHDDGISYLPLSHIAEQVVSLHGPMVIGACVWFAESLEKLGDNLREVRPHYFLGVPRVWEKIQAKIQAAARQNPPLKQKIGKWAKGVGLAGGYAEQEGRPKPLLYGLANKLVFSKLRERLGLDRCRIQITSAAPISRDTLEFFLSLGVPIFEVYGMSECTGPATISTASRYRTGKAGYVLPGTELKIAEDGEICMRGRHVFKGYFKNPEATAQTIDADGWLHSGDIGTIDPDGFLRITDRKKDLIITAGGENIAPQEIEGRLKAIPGVGQAVVIGDRRKYLTALIALDPEKLPAATAAAGSSASDVESAARCERFAAYMKGQIEAINGQLARVQTIKKWLILPGEFTIDGGELTPTMKIKRKVVAEKYQKEIESLYAGAE